MNATARFAIAAALAAHLACASEIPTELDPEADAGTAGTPSSTTTAGRANGGSAGTLTQPQATAGRTNGGSAGKNAGGAGGATGVGGASQGGTGKGGSAGAANGGSTSASGAAGSTGQAGSPNQTLCDDTNAVDLMTQYTSVTVVSNACLKLTIPSDQIKKVTMQPDSGTYPVPFSWSNCGATSSGAFTANYANQAMTPVSSQCPIYVKLGGNGDMLHFQWWGD